MRKLFCRQHPGRSDHRRHPHDRGIYHRLDLLEVLRSSPSTCARVGGLLKGLSFAGKSSESAILETASAQAVQRVQSGQGLAEALRGSRLPDALERAIEVGEETGTAR